MKGRKERTVLCEYCHAEQVVKIRAGSFERVRCGSCGRMMEFFIPV